MKLVDFERLLKDSGYVLISNSKHRKWSNGVNAIVVPQGRIINRMIARRLLKEIGYAQRVPELNFG